MINDLPPLNAVRAFASAARHQSFSRAAEELHVTHSAVSRHIRLLEERLGAQLFERRNRRSLLTPIGQSYYEQISQGLAQIANATHALRHGRAPRKVTINVRPSFAVRWLIPRLPDFMAQFPDIQPEIVTSTLAPDQARESFDVVVRRGCSGWASNVQPNVLREDDVLLVAAPALLQVIPVQTPADVLRHTRLSGKTRSGDWQAWCTLAGLNPTQRQPPLQFDHLHLVLQAAVDGLGLALCPSSLLGKDLATGRLCNALPHLRLPLTRYYYGVSRDAGTEAQVFIDWMFSQFSQGGESPWGCQAPNPV